MIESKITANNVSTENAKKAVTEAQKKVLTETQLSAEKTKVDTILIQRDAKIALENLELEVQKKKNLSETDKRDYERLYALVPGAEQTYLKAEKQYNDKKELDVLLTTLQGMPKPTTAQINARKNLETL